MNIIKLNNDILYIPQLDISRTECSSVFILMDLHNLLDPSSHVIIMGLVIFF